MVVRFELCCHTPLSADPSLSGSASITQRPPGTSLAPPWGVISLYMCAWQDQGVSLNENYSGFDVQRLGFQLLPPSPVHSPISTHSLLSLSHGVLKSYTRMKVDISARRIEPYAYAKIYRIHCSASIRNNTMACEVENTSSNVVQQSPLASLVENDSLRRSLLRLRRS